MAEKGSITITSGKRRSGAKKGGRTAQLGTTTTRATTGGSKPGQVNLAGLFGAAAESMDANREQLNALDGFNGNHGDNMAYNMHTVTKALQANRTKPPSVALRAAALTLGQKGQGGTAQYYARGLERAADQLEGRKEVGQNEIMTLLQTILGSVPAEASSGGQAPAGGSILETLLGGLAGAAGTPSQGGQAPEVAGGGLLEGLLGVAGGGAPGQPSGQADAGLGVGDLLNVGLSLLGSGSGSGGGGDTLTTVMKTVLGALGGSGGGSRQYNSPREASGSLVMQSILQALLGGR
jgi:hypothetical protein